MNRAYVNSILGQLQKALDELERNKPKPLPVRYVADEREQIEDGVFEEMLHDNLC